MAGVKIPVVRQADMMTEPDTPLYAMGRLSALGRIYGTPVPFAVRHPFMHKALYRTGGLSLGAITGLVLGSFVDASRNSPENPSPIAGTALGTAGGGLLGLLIGATKARNSQFRAADKVSDQLRMAPLPPDASSYTRELLSEDPEEGESDPILERLAGTRPFSRGKRDAYRQFLARGDKQTSLTDLVDDSR